MRNGTALEHVSTGTAVRWKPAQPSVARNLWRLRYCQGCAVQQTTCNLQRATQVWGGNPVRYIRNTTDEEKEDILLAAELNYGLGVQAYSAHKRCDATAYSPRT